jgi:hypothetical protein
VKRIGVTMLGFGWGLFLTWLTLYTLSHVGWPHRNSSGYGCSDMEHCNSRLMTLSYLAAMFFGPAIAFASPNAIAYRRWSVTRWFLSFSAGSFLLFLFYLAGYCVFRRS